MGAQVYTMEMLERDLILEGVSMLQKKCFGTMKEIFWERDCIFKTKECRWGNYGFCFWLWT